MDESILIGAADPSGTLSLGELAEDVSELLGYGLVERHDGRMFHGGDEASSHVWLEACPEDDEPHASHPFELRLSYTDGPLLSFAETVFERLAQRGRYRLVLLSDYDYIRATHYRIEWQSDERGVADRSRPFSIQSSIPTPPRLGSPAAPARPTAVTPPK